MANLKLDDSRKAVTGSVSTSSGSPISDYALPLGSLNAKAVAIVDASGVQITSFGGGTQYTDAGTAPANPVGPTIEWSESGTWRTVSTAKPLPVTANLAAETTKVIGVVRNADGSGNLWTSNSTTFTAKFAQDVNLLGSLGTAFSTAGKVDIKGADGDVFVRQATGTNLHVVLDTTSTTAVTQATGTNLHTVVDSGTITTVTTLTNQTQEGGVNISLNAGAVDTGTRRVVQANGAGKTIVSTGGSAASNGNNTLVAAGTNKLKVFAFTLSTTSTTAMTCIFQSGASGTELWRVILQAGTSVSTGANLTVSPPAWLFATASATLLNLNLSSANAVHWSVSYFDEA